MGKRERKKNHTNGDGVIRINGCTIKEICTKALISSVLLFLVFKKCIIKIYVQFSGQPRQSVNTDLSPLAARRACCRRLLAPRAAAGSTAPEAETSADYGCNGQKEQKATDYKINERGENVLLCSG